MDNFNMDINKERIKDIVNECIFMINEYQGDQKFIDKGKVLDTLDKILDSNKISVEFFIPLPNNKMPDLILRIDPRSKKLLLKSKFRKKVNEMNHFVRVL